MKALDVLYIIDTEGKYAYLSKDSCIESDRIYEAIKELEELQNRTCKNCNYFTSSPNTNKYDCCEKRISDSSISFYCNKWEKK